MPHSILKTSPVDGSVWSVPFGHEAAEEVGLEVAKFDVVTSDDEIVEVVGDEELGGIVPALTEVEVGIIEDGGGDIGDREGELEDVKEDK
jgi:catabolite regulation protein CreA